VGPTDSGKSTIAQILAAYAVRMDRSPVLVDLDVGQSGLTIPGCISAAQLSKANLSTEVSLFVFVFVCGTISCYFDVVCIKLRQQSCSDNVRIPIIFIDSQRFFCQFF
jgi:hypothetical protein